MAGIGHARFKGAEDISIWFDCLRKGGFMEKLGLIRARQSNFFSLTSKSYSCSYMHELQNQLRALSTFPSLFLLIALDDLLGTIQHILAVYNYLFSAYNYL
ncbi:hypothetical protein ACJX0J_027385 [Zea mays]